MTAFLREWDGSCSPAWASPQAPPSLCIHPLRMLSPGGAGPRRDSGVAEGGAAAVRLGHSNYRTWPMAAPLLLSGVGSRGTSLSRPPPQLLAS